MSTADHSGLGQGAQGLAKPVPGAWAVGVGRPRSAVSFRGRSISQALRKTLCLPCPQPLLPPPFGGREGKIIFYGFLAPEPEGRGSGGVGWIPEPPPRSLSARK